MFKIKEKKKDWQEVTVEWEKDGKVIKTRIFDVAKQEWVTNSLLVLSWASEPSGRVEVVAYLS